MKLLGVFEKGNAGAPVFTNDLAQGEQCLDDDVINSLRKTKHLRTYFLAVMKRQDRRCRHSVNGCGLGDFGGQTLSKEGNSVLGFTVGKNSSLVRLSHEKTEALEGYVVRWRQRRPDDSEVSGRGRRREDVHGTSRR